MPRASTVIRHTIDRFRTDPSAAVGVEYSLLASLIVVAALVGFIAYRDSLAAIFNSFAGYFN